MKIRLEEIGHRFGKREVLKEISLEIQEGLFYGVTGDNGSGKTTLFRIIAGLLKPSTGIVYYDGLPWKKDEKEITYMHQKPYMMKSSVEENIRYPLKLRGVQEETIRREVDKMMEELDLLPLAKQQAQRVSGGEAQKIALARALIFQPKILLMDEPTANIDPETKTCIFEMLRKRQRVEGLSTLMITHDQGETMKFFNQVICMERGGIVCTK